MWGVLIFVLLHVQVGCIRSSASGEVGTFCTVLLSVSSRTCLQIFNEISLYLKDVEQKNNLAHF